MSDDQSQYSEVTDKLSAVQKKNTHMIILEQLEELIISGTLKPGQRLPGERTLSEKFGVSRNSVRVATKLLEFMNLLETRPGSGVYVASRRQLKQAALNSTWTRLLKQHPLMDLIEARLCIEPFISGLSARNATDMEIREMEKELDAMETKMADGDREEVALHASNFHTLLFKSSKNIILGQVGMMLHNLMDESKNISLANSRNAVQSLTEHREILSAIKSHDSALAEEIMNNHLNGVKDHLQKAGL